MEINLHLAFTTTEEFEAYCRNFLGQGVVPPTPAVEAAAAPVPVAEKPKRTRRSKKQIAEDKAVAEAKKAEPEPIPAEVGTTDVTNVMDDDYTPDITPKLEADETPLNAREVLTAYIDTFEPAAAKARLKQEGVTRIGQIAPDKLQGVLKAMMNEIAVHDAS